MHYAWKQEIKYRNPHYQDKKLSNTLLYYVKMYTAGVDIKHCWNGAENSI